MNILAAARSQYLGKNTRIKQLCTIRPQCVLVWGHFTCKMVRQGRVITLGMPEPVSRL